MDLCSRCVGRDTGPNVRDMHPDRVDDRSTEEIMIEHRRERALIDARRRERLAAARVAAAEEQREMAIAATGIGNRASAARALQAPPQEQVPEEAEPEPEPSVLRDPMPEVRVRRGSFQMDADMLAERNEQAIARLLEEDVSAAKAESEAGPDLGDAPQLLPGMDMQTMIEHMGEADRRAEAREAEVELPLYHHTNTDLAAALAASRLQASRLVQLQEPDPKPEPEQGGMAHLSDAQLQRGMDMDLVEGIMDIPPDRLLVTFKFNNTARRTSLDHLTHTATYESPFYTGKKEGKNYIFLNPNIINKKIERFLRREGQSTAIYEWIDDLREMPTGVSQSIMVIQTLTKAPSEPIIVPQADEKLNFLTELVQMKKLHGRHRTYLMFAFQFDIANNMKLLKDFSVLDVSSEDEDSDEE
jgi:hypothetical protein